MKKKIKKQRVSRTFRLGVDDEEQANKIAVRLRNIPEVAALSAKRIYDRECQEYDWYLIVTPRKGGAKETVERIVLMYAVGFNDGRRDVQRAFARLLDI